MFNLFSKSTSTITLKARGQVYFTNNLKALKRPLNPDYKDKSVSGKVFKYVDVNIPVVIDRNKRGEGFVVLCGGKPISYIALEDAPTISKLLKRITSCTALISGGDCRIDSDKYEDTPEVVLTIAYKD